MLVGRLSGESSLACSLSGASELTCTLSASGRVNPAYDGPTSVTPGETEQVLITGGYAVLSDIIVNPIPSNYGRIERRGAALRLY